MLEEEENLLIKDMHQGIYGGHFVARDITHKILRFGYFWPTLFSDVHKFVRVYHECQMFSGRQKIPAFPLMPVQVETPFQQWGLDFIGEIHPPSSGQHKWILTTTNYFTKWVESIPTRHAIDQFFIKFLEENILSRFDYPLKNNHK
jgi:hypothetical protein